MASEDESSKGFKIQDRRRFSAEGELKPEFSGADEPTAAKPDAPPPGRTAYRRAAAQCRGAGRGPPPQHQTAASSSAAGSGSQGLRRRAIGGRLRGPSVTRLVRRRVR